MGSGASSDPPSHTDASLLDGHMSSVPSHTDAVQLTALPHPVPCGLGEHVPVLHDRHSVAVPTSCGHASLQQT